MIPDDVFTDPDSIQLLYGVPEDETLLAFYSQQIQTNSQMVDPRRPNPTPSGGFDPEQTLVPTTTERIQNDDVASATFDTVQTPLRNE